METTGEAVAAAGLRVIEPVTTMVLPSSPLSAAVGAGASWALAVLHSSAKAVRLVATHNAAFMGSAFKMCFLVHLVQPVSGGRQGRAAIDVALVGARGERQHRAIAAISA